MANKTTPIIFIIYHAGGTWTDKPAGHSGSHGGFDGYGLNRKCDSAIFYLKKMTSLTFYLTKFDKLTTHFSIGISLFSSISK